jgi:hypothetical protein
MTNRPSCRRGTADIVPASMLFHRSAWRRVRGRTPGAYIIGLPADNPKLRLRLRAVADRLLAKGLPVTIVETRPSHHDRGRQPA